MSRNESSLCGVVLRHAKKSLKRAKATSQEILSQISASHSSEVRPLYGLFLKELESRKDPQEKTKD
jgi:hypothetical protein